MPDRAGPLQRVAVGCLLPEKPGSWWLGEVTPQGTSRRRKGLSHVCTHAGTAGDPVRALDARSVSADRSLVVAYADPPYIGQSKKHYKDHPDYAGEVDHANLLDRLLSDYPDGWALSLHTPSLEAVQRLLNERDLFSMNGDYRVLSWVKTFGAYKRNVRVAYVWEPVIVRVPERLPGAVPTRDFAFEEHHEESAQMVLAEPITMRRGLTGAKPERFCFWLFNVLGLRPTDEIHDLFPGSRAVLQAWDEWCRLGGPKLKQSVKVTSALEPA